MGRKSLHEMGYSMKNDNKLRGKNAIYRITLVAALFIGIRTAAEFIMYLASYGSEDTKLEAEIAMENFTYMGLFLMCIVTVFILSIISRKYVGSSIFMMRTVFISIAFFLALFSMPAMLTCATISLAKYEGELDMLREIYSSELYYLLESQPLLFYSFLLAILIVAMLSVVSFAAMFVDRYRNRNGGAF